jgi:hypothetical protein
MKKSLIFTLIQILIFVCVIFGQDQSRKIVRIDFTGVKNETVKELFKSGIDVTSIDRSGNSINALVTESEIQKIKNLGFKSEILLPDADAFARQLRQSGYFNHFHNYQQMLDEMQKVVADYPDLALLEDIGDSYEKTIGKGGYDIWALKISDNVHVEEDEPEVFYMANMHAREIITPEIIMYFMHYLIDNYGSDAYVTYLVDNRQVWLCPTFNPDGHEYVFSGSTPNNWNDPMWWRKNKRDNNGNGFFDPDSDGVDLNRNFGYAWGFDNFGSSPYPISNIYRGTGPFSEPESQAIRDFAIKHNFIITLSFHSHSQLWLYPWGYTSAYTPDHNIFKILADSCVAYNGYKPETGYELYPVNGDTDDWFYGEQTTKNKIFAFTPEVGNYVESVGGNTGFFPDTMFIEKQILENQGPMLYLAYAAGEEPIIEHDPLRETESPGPHTITAKIKPAIPLTSPVLLDDSSFKLFYGATGTIPFYSISMQPTSNPDEYQAEIPCIPSADTIYYYLQASDQNGKTAMLPRGASMAVFAFSIGPDMEPPAIEHNPIEYVSIYAQQIAINVFVFDNIGVSKVELHYRKNGGGINTLDMAPTQVTNEYQGVIIPDQLNHGDYYEYQVVAVDQSQNANKTSIPEAGYFRFNVKNSIIYDFEFESSFQTITEGDWQWGDPASGPNSAYSGSKLWATKLNGNYGDLTESILETPEISLADKDSAKLIFWHWYQNEYSSETFWDGGNIKISVDNNDFQVAEPEDGYDGVIDFFNTFLGGEPCFGGVATNGNFWHQEIVNLTPYINHTIKLRFHFASDEAVNDLGWYVDDVEIEFEKLTAVADHQLPVPLPTTFELDQNYPNPFNPETRIQYRLAKAGEVTLEIFNLLGEKVTTLVNEKQKAGAYFTSWQGKDKLGNEATSGVYFYRLMIKDKNFNHSFTRKMVKLQ